MTSGLYQAIVDARLLIPHDEVDIEPAQPDIAYKIIKPELIEFISYPYEWCFSQLKAAVLNSVRITDSERILYLMQRGKSVE